MFKNKYRKYDFTYKFLRYYLMQIYKLKEISCNKIHYYVLSIETIKLCLHNKYFVL